MKKLLQGLVIFLMVLVVGFFGLKDTIIKNVLEKELTNSLGSTVRIYGVDYSVFKELLELKGVGVESKENDAYDIVNIGKITTKLNYKELFNKKIRVDRVDIKDIGINVKTNRKNVMEPIRRPEEVKTKDSMSDEEIKNIANNVLKNYEALVKATEGNEENFKVARSIFLAGTTPMIDKYINYKIENIAEEYILEILDEYKALAGNIKMGLNEVKDMEWSIEVGLINLSTNLFGREFRGTIGEFSTDKNKMDKVVPFTLDSMVGGEAGKITGAINPYRMEGRVKTVLNNVDITQIKPVDEYVRGMAFLNQDMYLNGEMIEIAGEVVVKNIDLNREQISEKYFNDKNAVEKISGNSSNRIGDMRATYVYNPYTKKLSVNSNIAEEVSVYMGADVDGFKKLERDFKEKYGDEIKKGKEEIKSKLEGFLKSLK